MQRRIDPLVNPTDRFRNGVPPRVLVFASPKAGTGAGREQIPRLIDLVRSGGGEAVAVETVESLKQELSRRDVVPVVVAAGGDGTIALAAQTANPDVPLVPMPLGTENLLARQFGHRSDATDVFNTVRHGTEYQLDAGLANGRPFLIMASCGFDAEVVRGMHLTRGGHINRFSYTGPIVRAIRRYRFPEIHVKMNGASTEVPDCRWCMVFNLPRYAAKLAIEPDAVGNDGQLDLIGFQRGSVASGLRYVTGVSMGRHLKYPDVFRRRGVRFELTSPERVPYQLDGDYVGHLPLVIETLPGRVRLLLPTKRD